MAWLVLSIVSAIPTIGAYTPGGLAAPAVALATGGAVAPGDVAIPVVSTIVLITLCLAASAWSFRRQEL